MRHGRDQYGFHHILIPLVIIVIAIVGLAGWRVFKSRSGSGSNTRFTTSENGERQIGEAEAIKAGKDLSGGKCEGKGSTKLTALPMKPTDFAMILPYGLMVDGHVTPIDHQYFSPTDFESAPDTYEVYALADGRITEISHRGESVGNRGKPSNDYRFVFSHTCTFLTYFDLVTSLAPNIKAEFDKNAKSSGSMSSASLDIPVKAGQLVGYIGGQTLDFAVWDTTKPLSGFINPESYKGEQWKIYTADPLDYYAEGVKQQILAKYMRTDASKSGKIDWDVDGRLIGNWFVENSNGYEGDRSQGDGRYWRTHLAVAPDYLDPSYYIASFGSFKTSGDGEQFIIESASPDPKNVDTTTGLVKYQLSGWNYLVNGDFWDRRSHAQNLKITLKNSSRAGCALYQLLENRKLRAEPFPGKVCTEVSGFTSAAKTYTR